MSIVKTIPPIKMVVRNYRDAALQHFNTCKILWRYVGLPNTSNLKSIHEDEILKNIFYLCGYVVECAIKYRYLTDCHSLNDSDNEDLWRNSNRIPKMRHFSFTSMHDKNWSETVIQDLDVSSSNSVPNYLKNLGNVLPIVIVTPAEGISRDMQESWEPTIRYHYEANGLIINKPDIETFFQATKSLLHNFSVL